uniref:DUF7378 domain-containing protein n=1 Tax=Oryza brachyantha TaxID=4533 RepID=J3KWT7_ORYBR
MPLLALAPTPTVGEAQAEAQVPRAVLWIGGAYLVCIPVCSAAGAACWLCWGDRSFPGCLRRDPWRVTPVLMIGAYMAVLSLLIVYTHLFLPRAPRAVLKRLANVGGAWVMVVLTWPFAFAFALRLAWLAIAVDCVLLALLAAVIALWVRLARTYGSSD